MTYADGHEHCFSPGCGYFKKAPSMGDDGEHHLAHSVAKRVYSTGDLLRLDDFSALDKRRLTEATLRKFGSFRTGYSGKVVQVYPYHTPEGDLVAQKLRFPSKEFTVLKGEGFPGGLTKCALFGKQVYGDRFDRTVVITEGELDAMSVAQSLEFKIAAVSINTGAGKDAIKCLKTNYLWLDRFAEIVLWFDEDEAGQEFVEEAAKLFRVGKVKVVKGTGFKDASDILQANRPGDIRQAIYSAVAWRPRGIVNAAENPEDLLAPREDDSSFAYEWPWPEVTSMLGPMLPGQVTYHVAGTGIGKSTAVATISFHAIDQGAKVAYFSFEGTRREIKLALAVVRTGKRVDIEPLPDEDMLAIHKKVFGSGNLELFDPETAEWTFDALEGYIRYAVKALGCTVGVVDPLSAIVAMLGGEVDERRALDKVSMMLAKLSKELGVHLHVSHHLNRPDGVPHEEGAATSINHIRGSGGIAMFATFVIGHERNSQAAGEDWKLTQLRSLKNRPRSKTGPIVTLRYNWEKGQLEATSEKFPGPSGKTAGKGGSSGGFGSAHSNSTSDDY